MLCISRSIKCRYACSCRGQWLEEGKCVDNFWHRSCRARWWPSKSLSDLALDSLSWFERLGDWRLRKDLVGFYLFPFYFFIFVVWPYDYYFLSGLRLHLWINESYSFLFLVPNSLYSENFLSIDTTFFFLRNHIFD